MFKDFVLLMNAFQAHRIEAVTQGMVCKYLTN